MKLNSYTITQGKDRAPTRSFLKGIGFTDEDLKKPIIGIANAWIGTMPCNFNLRELAQDVARNPNLSGWSGCGLTWEVVKDPYWELEGHSTGTDGHGGALETQGWIDPKKNLTTSMLIQRSSDGADALRQVAMTMAEAAVTN